VNSFTYTNVGATGTYGKIVTGWSKATGCQGDPTGALCSGTYKQPYTTSGALAPFNEELSLVFGGPVELYQIAVYNGAGGPWQRVAYWDRCTTEGLAFTGNKSWYQCGGFVQSYVTADGTAESPTPIQFTGSVPAKTEVNVFSPTACTGITAGSDCGWSDGLVNLHGFTGDAAGNRIFAVKMRMPLSTSTPAFWILPSQVLRTAQYGCNCRGAGCPAPYKGGCGELDVVEVTGGVPTTLVASTSIYSFQNCFGGVGHWDRPVNVTAIFLVIFDATGRQIAIRRLGATDFDFGGIVSASTVATWLAMPGGTKAMQ
jgi:hypothetical protein